MVLGWLGTIGLAKVALVLGQRSPRWGLWCSLVFSIILIGANALVTGTWISVMLHWRRLPGQIGAGIVVWLVVTGLGRLGLPRWSLLALAGAITIVATIARSFPTMLFASFFFMALLAGTICGAIVSRRGARRDGDITLAIFAGYVVGQWMIIFPLTPLGPLTDSVRLMNTNERSLPITIGPTLASLAATISLATASQPI